MRLWFLGFGVMMSFACQTGASLRSESKDTAESRVAMDPVYITQHKDPLLGLDAYDAGQMLEVGNRYYKEADYDRALQVFRLFVLKYPESTERWTAHFNAGLALEALGESREALTSFLALAEAQPDNPLARDALFRAGVVASTLKDWTVVVDCFWRLRQRSDLSALDEIEARLGLAVGRFMQNDYATAETEFRQAIQFYEQHPEKEILPASYWLAQARFYLGEIAAREFEALELKLSDATNADWSTQLGQKLEEKCAALLRAQNAFIFAIRIGHPGWATAAGFRIGSLYERLYGEMMALPVPAELSAEAQGFYRDALLTKLGVLVEKASTVYEQALSMAKRVGENNDWVEKTDRALERMRTLYQQAPKS